MSDRPTVVVRNLSKSYYLNKSGSERSIWGRRNRTVVDAVKNVSFATFTGECVGVLGRNGSGKSTLLSMIAGNESPTSGSVRVSSHPTLLGVSAALQGHLSGRANVNLGLLAMGLSPKDVEVMVPEVLTWAGLDLAADRPMKTYSSGMKSRLKFSIATAVRREILLVDEALSTGDSTFAEKAAERMEEFLDDAGTVFMVSHASGTIQKYCSRALWLHDGELIADGDPKFVTKLYRSWSKHLSSGDIKTAQSIIDKRKAVFSPPQIIFDSEAVELLDQSVL